ncbi:ABC-type bacteriocin/lantibiotic exporter with double-glycine peptidase domain [Flavobacterium sp. 7E]|uniref:peptidase domain-containing ABC transporter n=1 Tax=unclassified Flavobacterium TaxID=196869 RepID=UPI00157135FC|nr:MULTISPECIES: ATP-binding cassette domain-containing protein [unclassified Flavobacterium]MBE0392807.1 Alpha-hemolysin translocation ATP-binding protein HlyB [Flavobacterium sp. PL002]NRS87398.1 ABC-type bacteriocin/lantibiotic exporter with double-glycine peptidase domain [Flavobacterium sp. 7E]
MTPLKRFYNLLALDKKDIYQLFFYAIFAGLVSLSLPLGIQAIINFIQSGRVSVSWIVLIFLVVVGVGLVGILSLMQLRITENLQQKIFVRSSFEFAVRLPKIKFEELYNTYPPELANRFFDTMTIQKGTSKLLIDFSAALLQIIFGVILLSLYHPYFILFGIMLIILLYFIFKLSYIPGLETSLKESKNKYKVAQWLQEMARNNYSFRNQLNFDYGLQKNDKLVSEYLNYREKHFNIIRRQFSQLIIFKIIITASLLSIGGFLVVSQQMNIGQFVAAEIIILLVINSVEKIILGLETFYDVLTSVEKIGQVTDLYLEEEYDNESMNYCYADISLETENLQFKFPDSKNASLKAISLKVEQGERIIIDGENGSGKTTLIRVLSGLLKPTAGSFYINDDTFKKIDLKQYRSQIGSVIYGESPFEGTYLENITFNDPNISQEDLKWAIEGVQLSSFIKSLPNSLDTAIYPEGRQLSSSNAQKILLARSIIHKPKILFYEDPTDKMDDQIANAIIDFITAKEHKWTIIVSSKNPYWKTKCNRVIIMEKGRIQQDTKKL